MLLVAAAVRDFDGKSFSQDAGADPGELWREDDGHASLVSRAIAALSARASADGGEGE